MVAPAPCGTAGLDPRAGKFALRTGPPAL